VAEVGGIDPATCARAIDALVAADLLAEGEPVTFAHPIIASSVYADMRASERAAGHSLAARILLEDGVPPERAAPHLLAAPRGGKGWLVEALQRAARRAMAQGAPESAVTFLRRALEEPPPPEARAEVLLELGQAEAAAGEPGAESRLEHALELLHDAGARAEALLATGRNLHARGRSAEAAETFERALAEVGDHHDLSLTLRSAYAAAAAFEPSLRGSAFERLGPALEDGKHHPPQARRVALANLAGAKALEGRDRAGAVALALKAWDGGQVLAEGTSDEQSIWGMVAALHSADRPATALPMIDAAIEDARKRGSVHGLATALFTRGAGHWYLGQVPSSVADVEQAIEARRHGWEVFLPAAYGFLLQGLLEMGRLDHGETVIAQVAGDLPRWRDTSPSVARYLHAHGQWLLARGDATAALQSFLEAGRAAVDALDATNPAAAPWRSAGAIAALRAGQEDRARALAEEELDLARVWGAPRSLGIALRGLGLVKGGTQGLALLEEAVATLEHSEARLVHARVLADLGSALRRAGKRADARAPLKEALDLAVRAGSRRVAEAAHHELLAAGGRPRRQHLTGLGSLTPSELRVARMAAQGLTNREIAEVLFVTVKAVQFHLTSVYRKLEIQGRGELAEALDSSESEEAA
jgi:DNA-binding CsgD family transcriptional regulator/Tfp pilus assembly protein PilF